MKCGDCKNYQTKHCPMAALTQAHYPACDGELDNQIMRLEEKIDQMTELLRDLVYNSSLPSTTKGMIYERAKEWLE